MHLKLLSAKWWSFCPAGLNVLSRGRDKMVAVSQTTFSNVFSLNEKVQFFIQISLKLDPKSPTNNKSALVQMMALRWSGDKPLSEPMMGYFTDAHMRRSASTS